MEAAATAEVVPYEPVTEQERAQREEFDRLLAGVQADKEAQAYTLPELMGDPVPYEALPGLYYKRPKLGHKMDLLRRYQAIQDRYSEDDDVNAMLDRMVHLLLPYVYVKADDGSLDHPSAELLLFEYFEDAADINDFFTHIYTSKKAANTEGGQGN